MEEEPPVLGGEGRPDQMRRHIVQIEPTAPPPGLRQDLPEQDAVTVEKAEGDDRPRLERPPRIRDEDRGRRQTRRGQDEGGPAEPGATRHFSMRTTASGPRPKTSGAYISSAFVPGARNRPGTRARTR